MKIKKIFILVLLPLIIIFTASCAPTNQESDHGVSITYRLTLILNGGELENSSAYEEYEQGKILMLPIPTRSGYNFAGWYEDSYFNDEPTDRIPATASGNKIYYAKWEKDVDKHDKSYSVILELNGGNIEPGSELTEYREGIAVTLPIPTRKNFVFKGWFDNPLFSGNPIVEISATETGDKIFYAKWEKSAEYEIFAVYLILNGGKLKDGENITSYQAGSSVTLPVPEKDNCNFDGWFDNAACLGNQVFGITPTDTGDKTFYAKWTEIDQGETLTIKEAAGYEEGAYVEVGLLNDTQPDDYTVTYRLNGEASARVSLERQAIRVYGNVLRADIVGLKKGTYEIEVGAKGDRVKTIVNVTSYDRSGYAHFGHETVGVGAYNPDGTPKYGAMVIYVTEENKNTVSANINGTAFKGIANILSNSDALNGTPLIVRIIGTIGAATWNSQTYCKVESYNDITGINNKVLPLKNTTQSELLAEGYNYLDTTSYSELEGLVSMSKWDGAKEEFDSYWNNCEISGASNITIEGIGTDAKIFQWGFCWKNCHSIEIRNLTFEDYPEDACSFQGSVNAKEFEDFNSQYIWIHNNTFLEGKNYWDISKAQNKQEGDGATDFNKNSNVTVSYNHYYHNYNTGIIGESDSHLSANMTFHHNWYESCVNNLPNVRQANIHVYNNFYENTQKLNMLLRANAYAFIENCYFDNAMNPIVADGGYAKVYNCIFSGKLLNTITGVKVVSSRIEKVENFNVFGPNFDVDPKLFYFNPNMNVSWVSELLASDMVPERIPRCAGHHR